MELTKKQRKKVREIISTYHMEQIVVEPELVYQLLKKLQEYQQNNQQEKAQILEQLTYHLITETALPVDYKSEEDNLSVIDLAKDTDSSLLQQALCDRVSKERINDVKKQYYKKYKR